MGRQRPRGSGKTRRTAYIHAGVDDENELHVQSQYHSSPDKTIASLIATAEKWMSLTTSKANTVSHTLKTHPPSRAAATPQKIFSFLDALPPEEGDEDVLRSMSRDEKEYFLMQNRETRQELASALRDVRKVEGGIPLRFRVVRSRLPPDLKKRIISKLDKQNETLTPGDSVKYNTWVEVLLTLPLGEVVVPQPTVAIAESMARAKAHLDSVVHGNREAKAAILERFYIWLKAPLSKQKPLALCGVPGNGKTTLIREGLAPVMARPFAFITLGGSTDSSSLLGHGYTYEGSTPGRIVEHLVGSRCCNPIFYFDELDKCSATPKGDEIINALVHFTDPVQADTFRDRYVGPLDIDTSRALCVFSFNSAEGISSILLDRLQIVQTDTFDHATQATIARTHLLPALLQERGLSKDNVDIAPEAIIELSVQCAAGGVRTLKSVLEQAVAKLALWQDAPDNDFLAPLRVSDIESTKSGVRLKTGLCRILSALPSASAPPPGMYS